MMPIHAKTRLAAGRERNKSETIFFASKSHSLLPQSQTEVQWCLEATYLGCNELSEARFMHMFWEEKLFARKQSYSSTSPANRYHRISSNFTYCYEYMQIRISMELQNNVKKRWERRSTQQICRAPKYPNFSVVSCRTIGIYNFECGMLLPTSCSVMLFATRNIW